MLGSVRPVHLGLRKLLLAALVASFGGQTALVYLDDTARGSAHVLSELAVQGRVLWHRNNCQVCHQIYGFGGFLGPDLTNAGPRLTRARLDEVLTVGNAQMPAFHFDSASIDAIEAYLLELDQTGVGVARRSPPLDARAVWAALEAHSAAQEPPAPAKRGLAAFQATCTTCHVPLQGTPLGLHTAPDLSTVVDRLDDAAIRTTIKAGRVARGMPAWPLSDAVIDDVVAYFHWLRRERDAIAARLPNASGPRSLPWWEYR